MNPYDTKSLLKVLTKRIVRIPIGLIPEGALKFKVRAAMLKMLNGIPAEFLINSGETVILVGFHRIDSVMMWSYLVGNNGQVVVIPI